MQIYIRPDSQSTGKSTNPVPSLRCENRVKKHLENSSYRSVSAGRSAPMMSSSTRGTFNLVDRCLFIRRNARSFDFAQDAGRSSFSDLYDSLFTVYGSLPQTYLCRTSFFTSANLFDRPSTETAWRR